MAFFDHNLSLNFYLYVRTRGMNFLKGQDDRLWTNQHAEFTQPYSKLNYCNVAEWCNVLLLYLVHVIRQSRQDDFFAPGNPPINV
jgi:hypothetical protein